jgi:hypothetical protein
VEQKDRTQRQIPFVRKLALRGLRANAPWCRPLLCVVSRRISPIWEFWGGENVDLGPLIDGVLVDMKDQKLVKNGPFIAQVEQRLLACRAIKAHSNWLLSPTEAVTVSNRERPVASSTSAQ